MKGIDLVIRDYTRSKRPALSRAVALRIAERTVRKARFKNPGTLEIGVVLVGVERMRKLNQEWRGKNEPTDVLSFPLSGPRPKGYNSLSLGDIVLCPVIVRVKAVQAGLPERGQMTWSLVHGLLHLMGYDHERGKTHALKMAVLEQKILKQ